MFKDDHRIGITPIVLRRAAYYLTLGVGEYFPEHPHHDKVVVENIYDFQPNPTNENEWGMGFRVSFYQESVCKNWVEFGCHTIGVGGIPILREVDKNE